MNSNTSGALLRDQAKQCLTGKYYGAVMIQLLASIINLILTQSTLTLSVSMESSINSLFHLPENNVLAGIFSYALILFASSLLGILNIGLTLFFLSLASGQVGNQWDLFYGYRNQFDKSFYLSLLLAAVNTFALFPLDLAISLYRKSNALSGTAIIILVLSQCVCGILGLYLSLTLSQCYFLLLDYPDMSTKKIITQSFKIMKGHKLRLLLLRISFLPLMFFNLFTLGIGTLWLSPYQRTTYSLFYLNLMTPANSQTN